MSPVRYELGFISQKNTFFIVTALENSTQLTRSKVLFQGEPHKILPMIILVAIIVCIQLLKPLSSS
jgi:hypothetical protein